MSKKVTIDACVVDSQDSGSCLMSLRQVSHRETQDDFDFKSPSKVKLIDYDGDSMTIHKADNLSEDDSPEKSVKISPTKKRMYSKHSLLQPPGSQYKETQIQEILEQSATHNERVREMREEIMTTRKEVGQALDDAKETLMSYQKSQAYFKDRMQSILFKNFGNEYFQKNLRLNNGGTHNAIIEKESSKVEKEKIQAEVVKYRQQYQEKLKHYRNMKVEKRLQQ